MIRRLRSRSGLVALGALPFVLVTTALFAQQAPPALQSAPGGGAGLAFGAYLARVGQSNLDLAAQRWGVPAAAAQVAVAAVFPDPIVTAGLATLDPSFAVMPPAVSLGVTVPIELGNKRGARVAVAQAQHQLARMQLADFLRTLRGEASTAFVAALHSRLVADRRARTYADLLQLARINEQRLRAGDVGEIAVVQSRVEAERFHGEVLQAEGERRAAELALAGFLGSGSGAPGRAAALPVVPAGELRIPARAFDSAALIAHAIAERPDVRAARLNVVVARARLDLAHANRWVDIAVGVGWTHNFDGQGDAYRRDPARQNPTTVSATPPFEQLSATLSVALPFSRVFRGEVDAARFGLSQAEQQLQAAQLRAEVQVRQALVRYDAAVARLNLYIGTLLSDAERVLAATLYNYQRGGATLLEVLNAQRTVNEAYLGYYDALADHARELIAVEQSAGVWDVRF